jgi:hypothetical protein
LNEDSDPFELVVASFAGALANSRKLQARAGSVAPVLIAIPTTTGGKEWRDLVDRLNASDPERGWGRMLWNGVEYVAYKGEFPGAIWLD